MYVDALHDRVGVLRDLEAWWPKLRAGGVMAGHDYMTQDDLNSFNDKAAGTKWPQQQNIDGTFDTEGGMVKGAVDDFFSCAVVVGDGHERAPERKRTAALCIHPTPRGQDTTTAPQPTGHRVRPPPSTPILWKRFGA